jgi:DNA invertase Pin-like site-specific DNA recombinase
MCERKRRLSSGKDGERQQFKALFAAASRREFDSVLFGSLDRFSREGVFETLQYLQRLTGYGVGYRSFTEQYLDSCGMFKDAVISILAVIARQERVRLSERTAMCLRLAFGSPAFPTSLPRGNKPPYGVRFLPSKSKVVEAAILLGFGIPA